GERRAWKGGACNGRRAKLWRLAAHHQHFAEFNDLARLAIDPIDPDHVFRGHPVLFAAGLDDCEHLWSSCVRSRCSDDPDRLLSVVLLFVFKGLIGPRKSTRTRGPARYAYDGETGGLSRTPTLDGARQEAGATTLPSDGSGLAFRRRRIRPGRSIAFVARLHQAVADAQFGH